MDIVRDWIGKQLANPQVVVLGIVLLTAILLITLVGDIMTPLMAAVVLAYLLEGTVARFEAWGSSRSLASIVVCSAFVIGFWLAVFALVPVITRQATQFVQELPQILATFRGYLMGLPERYPAFVTAAQVDELLNHAGAEVVEMRQAIVSRSLVVGVGLMYLAVYLILVPLLIFFMLKDKQKIHRWIRGFFPSDVELVSQVWADVDVQMSNYVRGKFLEIMIVGACSYVTFVILGLNYALMLGVIVGLSVVVPYIGAMVVTFPVAFVAFAQWGLGAEFGYVLLAYGVIQALDGNVLVPVLFSEAVDLHPVAIITAVLFFGGIWGFWGVFFAIPLATVINSVLRAWPQARRNESGRTEESEITPDIPADRSSDAA